MKRWSKKKIIALVAPLVLLMVYFCSFLISFPHPAPEYGVTFDPVYARFLTDNAGQAYLTVLQDWQFKHLRIPLHWDAVEKERGKYDFTDYDWYVDRAGDLGATVMLSIGQKTPRWPECHLPAWTTGLDEAAYRLALKNYMSAAVEHYKNHPALEIWQVENEPFLMFGVCDKMTVAELKEEVALVRQADPKHPILTADSGELSTWLVTSQVGDLFGTTLYRVVWNKYIGYWSYGFIPASFYRFKLWLVGRDHVTSYIVELQAEPWLIGTSADSDIVEQAKSMDLARLKNHLAYSGRIGLSRTYLWGAEWWYWLKTQGHLEIPDFIKQLPK